MKQPEKITKQISMEDSKLLREAFMLSKKAELINKNGPKNIGSTEDEAAKMFRDYENIWERIVEKYFDITVLSHMIEWDTNLNFTEVTLTIYPDSQICPDEQLKKIEEYRKELGDFIKVEDHGCTVTTFGKENLSQGCQSCKNGTWWCVFVYGVCNMFCKFCPQSRDRNEVLAKRRMGGTHTGLLMEDKIYYDIHKDIFTGVSYSGGEPLLNLNRILELANYISDGEKDVYQWIYTNGTLLTKGMLKQLKSAGINEIRFNLAATNFDPKIIEKLYWVRENNLWTTVEIPSIPEVYKALVEDGLLTKIPINQLNLAEMQLMFPIHWASYVNGGSVVKYTTYHGFHPSDSWEITYKILLAAKEASIDYIINDCSAQAKYLQQMAKKVTNSC